jgi:hypothetical protein
MFMIFASEVRAPAAAASERLFSDPHSAFCIGIMTGGGKLKSM